MRDGVVPWPADVAAGYVAQGWWRERPIGDYLWEWADRYGERTALVDGDHRLTYTDLAVRADLLAERLALLGLRRGDNILVQLPNSAEFVLLTLACLRLGVAPVMALLPHRQTELSYLAGHAEVAAIAVPDTWRDFDHQALAAQVARDTPSVRDVLVLGDHPAKTAIAAGHRDLRAMATVPAAGVDEPAQRRKRLDDIAPDAADVAVFLLSGGTTGLPKLISRTHNDYEYNARRSGEVSRLDADTRYLISLPAGHNFMLACPGILGTLMVGGRVVLAPSPEPLGALAAIEREEVTHTGVVPAVLQRWMDTVSAAPDKYQLDSLRVVQVGGAYLPPEVARQVGPTLGARLQQVLGMAEGLLCYVRLDDPLDIAVGTQGRPISPGDEILVADPDAEAAGQPVPPGEAGELWTRGPYTPRGYFRAAEHNATAFTPDGWYRTGDLVRRDPHGNIIVSGRIKDLINVGGEKVHADEIENLLQTLPQVARVAAVAAPDPAVGERVCVCVVLRPGTSLSLTEVQALFSQAGVAKWKIPQRLELLDTLPLTNVGKVSKKTLREYVAGAGAGVAMG